MKFLHTGDLHIGKTVHEFSMLKDQNAILDQIADIVEEEQVDALLIAGDVYDRSVPPADAVRVFDAFVERIWALGAELYVINGNHDSAERLGFASALLKKQGLMIASDLQGKPCFFDREDAAGKVRIHLVPFQRSAGLIKAVQMAEKKENAYNILVAHAFVTDGREKLEGSASESGWQVGTVDAVDVSVFDGFDYVALGHLHGSRQVGDGRVYYAGSPLKYSFSECCQEKGVYLIETGEKELKVTKRVLKPLHDMREIEGELALLTREDVAALADRNDYLSVVLTDKKELLDAMGTLRAVYPNVMKLTLKKNLAAKEMSWEAVKQVQEKTLVELFEEFYCSVRGEAADEERVLLVKEAVEEVGRI